MIYITFLAMEFITVLYIMAPYNEPTNFLHLKL
jgi:hypothetical protein